MPPRRDSRPPAWLVAALAALSLLCAPAGAAAANPLVTSFTAGVLVDGNTSNPQPADYATQAGSHPAVAFTNFTLNTGLGSAQDVRVDLPPGLSVNPQAIPRCSVSGSGLSSCPADTQVGTSTVQIANVPLLGTVSATGAVYNMTPPNGSPGDFAFTVTIAGLITIRTDLVAGLRYYPSNGQPGDYGEYFTISGISNLLGTALASSDLTFWGAPEEHNGGGAPDNAFLTNPTVCNGPATTDMSADTYSSSTGATSFTTPVGASGCASLPFSPTISVTPSTTERDQPAGVAVDIHVPQDENPADTATSELQNVTVTLPAGLTINPAAGTGLQACTDAQFAAGTNSAVTCPAASAVGTVEIDTPVLGAPLTGSIYIGAPTAGNPYRVFLDAENATSGVVVRLVGSVAADPVTGRLAATFDNNPLLPFSDLKLDFAAGAHALLASPLACGNAATSAALAPYSGTATVSAASTFAVDSDGRGGTCAATIPFAPTGSASLSTSAAGASPALTLNIARADGQQTLSTVTTQLPAGLVANVSAVPLCAAAAAAAGTCSSASQVGTAAVAAGAGTSPLSLAGTVYLTGPHDGAPFGLSIVVPAVAGPYDLGTVVVQAAVALDTVHGQLTITTDPLPTILQGIPLRIKTVTVTINRANLLVNPTSCAASAINGTTTSVAADSVAFSSPVQITGCAALSFAPSLSVSPSTTMADSPVGLTVDLHLPAGSPDLQGAVVQLPAGLSINPAVASGLVACTDSELGAGTSATVGCPAASQIGTVEIDTPLLSSALTGAIYIGSPQPGNPYRLFLDAESAAFGISVRLVGSLAADPSTGQLTATFANTPAIPFTDLKLSFSAGAHAALASPAACGVASTNATLTPVSGSAANPGSAYTVDANGSGGACPSSPAFAPTLSVAPQTATAGAPDAVTFAFASGDQQQKLGALAVTLPPGLLGALASVARCAEPAATQGACAASSRIGTATVSAGVGASPLQLAGPVYLTGPYGGAPFGLSIAVPADAGPYQLGTVVVRAGIAVDPHDAHLTITSGALPTILQGVPLRLKGVQLTIDRAGFMFNPTSCQAQTVSASITSATGTIAPAQAGFAPTGCAQLAFAPSITATVGGGPDTAVGASLAVTITAKTGQANLQSVSVKLPGTLGARQSTLDAACPPATYQANPSGCPAASLVGSATASTPVLPDALSGPVYLVAHAGALPTLELALAADGVSVDLSGAIAVTAGGLATTFNSIPDVPISSFTLKLPSGPSSVLATSARISCTSDLALSTTLGAHNGASLSDTTRAQVSGCSPVAGASGAPGGGGAGAAARWLALGITRIRHLRHHVLRIEVRLPASGKLTLSARSIHPVSAWAARNHRFVWVTLRLTRYGQQQLLHRRRLKVKMRAGYRARTGRSGWIYKSITFI